MEWTDAQIARRPKNCDNPEGSVVFADSPTDKLGNEVFVDGLRWSGWTRSRSGGDKFKAALTSRGSSLRDLPCLWFDIDGGDLMAAVRGPLSYGAAPRQEECPAGRLTRSSAILD